MHFMWSYGLCELMAVCCEKNWTLALHCKLAVTSILYSKMPLCDYQ